MSGCRLACRIEMVSRPPEKIRSTATAEPSSIKALVPCTVEKKYKSLTRMLDRQIRGAISVRPEVLVILVRHALGGAETMAEILF